MYLLVVIPSQLIGQINEKACDPQPDAHKYGISHSVNGRIDLNQYAVAKIYSYELISAYLFDVSFFQEFS